MSDSGENSSKSNGLGTDPLQRLSSFKAPRDLSLGGVKPNKKIFTPNLNVTRNKSKGGSTATREHKKDDHKRERRNDRNKNFKNGPNIIKSSGVFSEGLGASERHSSHVSYGRSAEAQPTLQKPTIRVKDFVKIDKELEEKMIKSVVGDTSHEESVNFRLIKEKDAPVKLPMDDGGSSQIKPGVKVKQEVVVKSEPTDDVEGAIVTDAPLPEVKKEIFENIDVVNLLRNEEPTMILIQLPDTLPGRGGSVDDEPRKSDKPSTSSGETSEEKPVDPRCHLSDLEEGKIGKLQIRRSGRVTMVLGETTFEVSLGTRVSFHQEAVSVAADDASRAARLVALGPLRHRMLVAPLWEHMFANTTN